MDPLQQALSLDPHPKIKPILIQRFCCGKYQNERSLAKSSKSFIKEFHIPDSFQLTKRFTKVLVSQQTSSKLESELRLYYRRRSSQTSITYFFSKIKELQCLTSFTVHIDYPDPLTPLKPLMMSLASLKNLSNLNIICISYLKDPKALSMIFNYLKRIPTLKNLTISFPNSRDIVKPHLNALFTGLSKLHQLQGLSLTFYSSFWHSGYLHDKLTRTLPRLRSLTKIDIRLKDDSDISYSIPNLFKYFSKMKNLSDISLGLENKYTGNPTEPVSEGLSLLDPSRIQRLGLQLYQKFLDKALIQLSGALKNFTSLRILHLGLITRKPFKKKSLSALGSTLSSLVSLSSLSITIRLKPDDKGLIGSLAIPFKSLTNLISLKLLLEGKVYSGRHDEVQQLFSSLRCLKSLKFLTLKYPHPEVNDQNLETLGESLKELPQLQNLSLDFSFYNLVTNYGIEALASSIKSLKSLSSLLLWFQSNPNLDNKTIDLFTDILRNLPQLYSVDLSLNECYQIACSDELLRALKEIKGIGEISLNLRLPGKTMSQDLTLLRETKIVKKIAYY